MKPFSVAKVIYKYIFPQNSRLQARILAMRLASEAAGGAATTQGGRIYGSIIYRVDGENPPTLF